MPDPVAVNQMFGRIAGRYDLANRLLSGGLDVRWRKRLVREVAAIKPNDVLDLATGSGDVAFALRQLLPKATRITGMDFCQPMLDEAERKMAADSVLSGVTFQLGNALDLPVPDGWFDAVTIAFGLRNTADRGRALREMRRVLRKPSGTLFVLEFSQPQWWFAPFYFFYLHHVLPHIARWCTGDKAAYDYLAGSIEEYPDREAISTELRNAGFNEVRAIPLTLGSVALHIARS
ncbi:MAG TPA: bifunctional demethylmenaquinone methyltransferase/2-methoxy-6-polyprenyl-1,4-benzoquinol methylase UbiE [Opitutaceae bacterium]